MRRLHKNFFKFTYYAYSVLRLFKPVFFIDNERKNYLKKIEKQDGLKEVGFRVNYYNRLTCDFVPSNDAVKNKDFVRKGQTSSYFLDLKNVLRNFPSDVRFDYIFGDVVAIPYSPSFVKTRPIGKSNDNSVILKLNSVRHYYIYPDKANYRDKRDMLVWRGAAHQPHRKKFVKKFYDHPLCDIGCVHKKSINETWHKPFMSISEQLNYKFILSIEGNDVATNLKWIMASSSLCFMIKPRFESWFMEGLLKPGYHYVELRDDYSDIEEKISYYLKNPDEAEMIIKNANEYVAQFMDVKKERLIGFLVVQKYFERSKQIKAIER